MEVSGCSSFNEEDTYDTNRDSGDVSPTCRKALFAVTSAEVCKIAIELSAWEELSYLSSNYEEIPLMKAQEATFVRKSSFAKSKSLRVPKKFSEDSLDEKCIPTGDNLASKHQSAMM